MKTAMVDKISYRLVVCILAFLALACSSAEKSTTPRDSQGSLDTPAYHIERGDRDLIAGEYAKATRSYQNALDLAPDNSSALSGRAAALAGQRSGDDFADVQKQIAFTESAEMLQKAEKSAKTPAEQERYHLFALQTHVLLQQPKNQWYTRAQEHFRQASALRADNPMAHIFMARAEAKKNNFPAARQHYERVLRINKAYTKEADQELQEVLLVLRAEPGSRFGKNLALVKQIRKADLAALLVAEINLKTLYAKRNKKAEDKGFAAPSSQKAFVANVPTAPPAATDISGHPLELQIRDIIDLSVRGLEPDAAHRFHPNALVTRAEFAVVLEDILAEITGDQSLKTQYIGTPSPFPDLRSDVWYYNAARVIVERQLMQMKDSITNRFDPLGAVSGAEALISVRELKNALDSYTY